VLLGRRIQQLPLDAIVTVEEGSLLDFVAAGANCDQVVLLGAQYFAPQVNALELVLLTSN